MAIYYSRSARETENIGFSLAKTVEVGSVVALFGELGAGKTAFVRGFARGMGINAEVTSPTFALVNEYRSDKKALCHFDMYRITGEMDNSSHYTGLITLNFGKKMTFDAIGYMSWGKNIEAILPQDCVRVTITKCDDPDERQIEIIGAEILENISD